MIIESSSNQKIKLVRSLYSKKYRDSEGAYIVESVKLIKEAIVEKSVLKFVLICDSAMKNSEIKEIIQLLSENGIKYHFVKSEIFKSVSNTITSQGIVAVVEKNIYDDLKSKQFDFIVFCDKLQDPGNLGTIIRTADAFGPCVVALSLGCVDAYNDKTVRACAGAIYRANIVEVKDTENYLGELKKDGFKIISTVVDSDSSFEDIGFLDKVCLVIGNEGNGVSNIVKSLSDINITIRMTGNTESLNASIAAGISIYEIRKKLLHK